MVASCAPARLLIWVDAHWPNAAEPPVRFISCTIIPRIIRKIRMPTFHLSDRTVSSPCWNTWFRVPTRSKPAFRNAPVRIPRNRELYTSLVISASAMAITGGVNAQAVSFTGIWLWTTAYASPASTSTTATSDRYVKVLGSPFFTILIPHI